MNKRKIIILLLAALLCLSAAACSKGPAQTQEIQTEGPNTGKESEETRQESGDSIHSGSTAAKPEEATQQSLDLVGPWHLDSEKNDLAAFSDSLDLFPGYGEWGASMEIRSDGLMSWYIGAEGWHGTYTAEEGVIHAQLTSDSEQSTRLWGFRIVTENETAILEMDYEDMAVYWVYGDQEEPANGTDNE